MRFEYWSISRFGCFSLNQETGANNTDSEDDLMGDGFNICILFKFLGVMGTTKQGRQALGNKPSANSGS